MYKIATVTSTANGLFVKFTEDSTASTLSYKRLGSYTPTVGDKVIMLRTNNTYICLGKVV